MNTLPLHQHPPLHIGNDRLVEDPLDAPEYHPPLPEATLAAALVRTEADAGHALLGQLNALAWFVKLSHTVLTLGLEAAKLSPADVLAKQEEFAALERHLQVRQSPPLPSELDLWTVCISARDTLLELFQTGRTRLSPGYTYVDMELPGTPGDRARTHEDFNHGMGNPSFKTDGAVGKNGLIREFQALLTKYGSALRYCPRCKMLFVKPRKNAEYCSRDCQNAHYMKTMREKAKAKPKKGGTHHGTKSKR